MENIRVNINNFEAVLGTPTSQKLIRLLVIWSPLSVQDLVSKSNVSKSQVHITLKNLIAHSIVHSPSRGIYALSETPFAKLLKDAYSEKILDMINSEIYDIKQLLKQGQLDLAETNFSELVKLFSPMLEESFSTQLSSLSLRFMEEMENK